MSPINSNFISRITPREATFVRFLLNKSADLSTAEGFLKPHVAASLVASIAAVGSFLNTFRYGLSAPLKCAAILVADVKIIEAIGAFNAGVMNAAFSLVGSAMMVSIAFFAVFKPSLIEYIRPARIPASQIERTPQTLITEQKKIEQLEEEKNLLSQKIEKLTNERDAAIRKIEGHLAQAQSIDTASQRVVELEEELKKLQQRIQELTPQPNNANAIPRSVQNEINDEQLQALNSEIQRLQSVISELNEKNKNLFLERSQLSSAVELEKLKSKLQVEDSQRELTELREKWDVAQKEFINLRNLGIEKGFAPEIFDALKN